jgi:hypothetical protein
MPRSTYEQAKELVEKHAGIGKRRSLNDLVVTAVAAYVKMHKRKQIDAAFAGMANDTGYKKKSNRLLEEFEHSDWEALTLGEESMEEEPMDAASSSR